MKNVTFRFKHPNHNHCWMSLTDWLEEIETLHEKKRFGRIHKELRKYIDENPNCKDIEVLWRYARSLYDLSTGECASRTKPLENCYLHNR